MKQRVQFDFTEGAVEALDTLVERTGAASRAEVVRRALSLLDHVLTAEAAGGHALIKHSSGDVVRLVFL